MNISAINNATATPKFTGFTETVGTGYEKILKSALTEFTLKTLRAL